LFTALALTLIPVLAAAISGIVAAMKRPGRRVTSGLQHFAAGVVVAAAAIELLPRVLAQSPWVAVAGFSAGIVVMFGFRALSERAERLHEQQDRSSVPFGLLSATGVDFLVDGVILGAGFTVGASTGLLLTVALAIEYLFVGLSLSSVLAGSVSRPLVAVTPVGLSLLTVIGTAFGVVVLSGVSAPVLAGVLAFGVVAFMYLAAEELLVEAHERGETALGSVGFFVGFLIYLILQELVYRR
jgi:ZIP family zinc transporter